MTVAIGRTPVSLGGVALTNADRKARFLLRDSGAQNAPLFEAVSASRIGSYPSFARAQPPEGKAFPISIELLTLTEEQVRLLRDLADPRAGLLTLFIDDGDSPAVRRQVECLALGLQEHEPPFLWTVALWAPDPVLLSTTLGSFNRPTVTSAGTTLNPTNAGDVETYPTLKIVPEAQKNILDGWKFLRQLVLVNNSEAPLTDPVSRGGLGKGYPVYLADNDWDTQALVRAAPQLTTIADGGDGIDSTQLTIGVADGSGLDPNGGLIWIGVAGSGEQVRYASVSGNTITVAAGGRGWGGTTAQSHAEGTSIFDSKMVADGRDIAVFVNHEQVPPERVTLDGVNTPTTSLVVPLEVPAQRTGTLEAAIGTGDQKLVVREGVDWLPAGPGYIRIGSECLRYATRNLALKRLEGLTRGQRNTTAASHAAGDTIEWVPLDIRVAYGWADAPARPANPDPIVFDVALSSNLLREWTAQPWSDVEGPGGFVRRRTGQNRFADRVALYFSGGLTLLVDETPTASKPAFDTLELFAPCGIDDAAGAIEFDSTITGGAMVLEVEGIDLAGHRTILERYHGHVAGAQHALPHDYTDEPLTPGQVLRAVRFRGRQSVIAGALTDDIDEPLAVAAAAGQDLQTLTLDKPIVLLGWVVRIEESAATCNKNADGEWRTFDGQDPLNGKLALQDAGWSVPNASITTGYKQYCYFPVWATKAVVPAGQYMVTLFETGGALETLHWARNAQPLYPRGSRWEYNGASWDEHPDQDHWFLILGEFDENDPENETDNQPDAPSNTAHSVSLDNLKVVFDPTRTPTVDLRPEENAYYIEATVTPPGQDPFEIGYLQKFTGTAELKIDTKTREVIDSLTGDEVRAAVSPGDRERWFTVAPGTPSIAYTPVGAVDENVTLEWRSAWQA